MTKIEYVILETGHGKTLVNKRIDTRGKRSTDGYKEGDGNARLARAIEIFMAGKYTVQNLLGNCPINVPLKARVKTANLFARTKSVFISLHSNASTNKGWGRARGVTVFYYRGSVEGKKLAQCISDSLALKSKLKNRGIKPCSFYVLKNTTMPAVLIECGFMDNKKDLEIIKNDVDIHACAITQGVVNYERGRLK
jgi:N-acetylmuramoyl-L-alanine amidase